jgi:tetratricopeptide (TPR) repeat protein
MTNSRVQVQLKGTEKASNADGSVSISVSRRNLNYLLRQPDSVYVCYHLPTERLLACFAHDLYVRYKHEAPGWEKQSEVTVQLETPFNEDFQVRLRARVVVSGRSAMDRRLNQLAEPPSRVAASISGAAPLLDIPTSRSSAVALLTALLERGEDHVVSANFERFAAVLGLGAPEMVYAYLAEINLGVNRNAFSEDRVRAGIDAIVEAGRRDGTKTGSWLYCEGNAWLALGDTRKAIDVLESGLATLKAARLKSVAAMCAKNLGSAHEGAGDWTKAGLYYEEALALDPDLGEAHVALGNWHRVHGSSPEVGLRHLDAVSRRRGSGLDMSTVQAWRVELLFEVGDALGAFREINSLTSAVAPAVWVWPWCARQVSVYGRTSAIAAAHASRFWRRFVAEYPEDWFAARELFFCCSKLHAEGEPVNLTFGGFRTMAERLVAHDVENSALFWDRVGHWAQDEQNWEDAAEAYRKAHAIDPTEFGYCFGTALNFLGRHEEALEVRLPGRIRGSRAMA